MHDFKSRNKLIRQVGWWSIIINFVLFVLKLITGRSADSVAIVADAWHTLSDSLSPIIIILTAVFISRKVDKSRPHMHGQIEMISSIVLGIILLLLGLSFLDRSIHQFFEDKHVHLHSSNILWVMIISVVLKVVLAEYSFYGSRKTKSKMLKAQGWHQRADAISSFIVLIGVLLSHKIDMIDAILGIIVSGFILYNAYHITKDSVMIIIGVKVQKSIKDKIMHIIGNDLSHDILASDFIIHKYSNQSIVKFGLSFPASYDYEKSIHAKEKLEQLILKELNMKAEIHL